MLFGQWSARKSLRDITFSTDRQEHKLYHLVLCEVRRSTLADANKQRPAIIFEETYYKLYERLSAKFAPQPHKARQIKIIDAITIDRCAAVFPWARFRTRKGAIKFHTVLTGLRPQCVPVTCGKTHDRQDLSALEVTELYRRRWQVELFFKWIKQNLKIKAFYGASKDAVLIQIWTALIAYLLLVWPKFKTKAGWGLIGRTRLAQTMVLERLDMWAWLGLRSPGHRQPVLFNQRAGQQ
jgi:hypothetical protein